MKRTAAAPVCCLPLLISSRAALAPSSSRTCKRHNDASIRALPQCTLLRTKARRALQAIRFKVTGLVFLYLKTIVMPANTWSPSCTTNDAQTRATRHAKRSRFMAVSYLFIVKKHALVGQLHAVLKVVPDGNFVQQYWHVTRVTLQKWRQRTTAMQRLNRS